MKRKREGSNDINQKDGRGRTKLHRAALSGDLVRCRKLLDQGADLGDKDVDGWTPLRCAVCKNHTEIMRILIQAGADLNDRDQEGFTLLSFSASFVNETDEKDQEQMETLKMLIEEGADINAKNHYEGETALTSAATSHFPAVIKWLVEKGSDLEAKNTAGNTALMEASTYGWCEPDNVRELIKCGANIQGTNEEGKTALMLACIDDPHPQYFPAERRTGHENIARQLLEAGADIDLLDNHGNTALIYAGETGLWRAAFLMMKLSREHTVKEYKRFLFRAAERGELTKVES